VTTLKKTKNGYVVTRANDVAQNDPLLPNVVHHPSRVVFAVNDPNFVVPNVAQLSVDQLVNLFNTGLKSVNKKDAVFSESFTSSDNFSAFEHAGVQAKRLRELLEASKAELYVVNTAYDGKDLDNVLNVVNNDSGKLKVGNKGKLWTELEAEGLNKHAWKNEEKRVSAVKNLEDLVSKKAATLEPAPEEVISETEIDTKQA